MRLIAFLTEPTSVKSLLEHLGLPAEPPALAPARAPPLDDLDQTPAFDLTDRELAPEHESGWRALEDSYGTGKTAPLKAYFGTVVSPFG